MNLQQHPLSACFPSMSKVDFADLVNDIRMHGQHISIVLFEGMVLDGWHRYRACIEANIEPKTGDYIGDDPVGYVKSLNWSRRHMNASQRAAAIVELHKWKPAHREKDALSASLTASKAQMAKEAGVSERTIAQAKVVAAKGTEELKQAVKDGKVSVREAAEQAAGRATAKPIAKPDPTITVPLAQYQKLEDKYQELIEELETVEALRRSDPAKEMNVLRESLRVANRRRDELMVECKEKQKQIDYYKRELKKLGWKQQ